MVKHQAWLRFVVVLKFEGKSTKELNKAIACIKFGSMCYIVGLTSFIILVV